MAVFGECPHVTVVDGVSADGIYAVVPSLWHAPRHAAHEALAVGGVECHGKTGVILVLQLTLSFPGSRRSL